MAELIPWILWTMAAVSIAGVVRELLVLGDAIERMYRNEWRIDHD